MCEHKRGARAHTDTNRLCRQHTTFSIRVMIHCTKPIHHVLQSTLLHKNLLVCSILYAHENFLFQTPVPVYMMNQQMICQIMSMQGRVSCDEN